MASEVVTVVDDIQFPKSVTPSPSSKPLNIVGYGITDIEIHFLQIKFTAIGIYVDFEVASHLQAWKGKTAAEILADDSFFDALLQAPVEKFIRVVVIKEIKGSQYGLQLENAVRDRLVAIDKYEDEEEEALAKVVEFFQGKYMKKNSVITYHFPANAKTVEVSFISDEKKEAKITVENADVSGMIKKWYLGGSSAVSASTITSFTEGIAPQLK
ncbi:chalcone isomerase-like protein 2 [Cryptomeria japonica]|uniref:chalcone isomerase-like protein 2 n=1 Tax=Cryptomeria japonica TaxID=3369 RepID=UPI0025ACDBC0|nr:chalcone isomerase-like protein 2 [Cryptomeria japonica]